MALRRHGCNFAARSAHTLQQSYHTIPPIIPLTSDTPRLHQHVSRFFFQWHGATQTHFPPRPRKSTWRCDITDVIRHTVCPHTRSNPVTRYRQSSRSPATRRVYTSMFRAPQWHGATRTHFPPRSRKSAWHCDITDVFSPHGLPTHYRQSYHTIPPIIPLTSDTPRLRQHVSRFQWHGAMQTHFPPRPRKSAWRCDITNVIRHTVFPRTRSNHISH